jgi:hypothetical protein
VILHNPMMPSSGSSVSMQFSLTASQSHCSSVSLLLSLTAVQPHCSSASLLFSLTTVQSQQIRMFISHKPLRNDQKHLMSIFYMNVLWNSQNPLGCVSNRVNRLWVFKLRPQALNKCMCVIYCPIWWNWVRESCTWTCSNLYLNLFKPAHEPVQICTWTCSSLHMNLFNPAHEPVQTCTWTCSNL